MACCSWFFHEFCLAVFVATLWRSVAMWYMMWHRKWTDASLTSAVDWLLTQCGRSQTECRHACMQLVTSLSHCLPGQSVSLRRSMPVCLTASQSTHRIKTMPTELHVRCHLHLSAFLAVHNWCYYFSYIVQNCYIIWEICWLIQCVCVLFAAHGDCENN